MYELWAVPPNGATQIIVGTVDPASVGSVIALDQAVERMMASASQQNYRDIVLRYRFVALHQAEAKADPTTPAELKAVLAGDFDQLLGLSRWILQADKRRRVYMLQTYVQKASDAVLTDILTDMPPPA